MDSRGIGEITILYDEACGFCCECAAWLDTKPTSIDVRIVARGSVEGNRLRARAKAQKQACVLAASDDDELLVIDDHDRVYEGPAAFIMCLWALPEWEHWAERLAQPGWQPYARRLFIAVSKNRSKIAWLLGQEPDTSALVHSLPDEPIRCA